MAKDRVKGRLERNSGVGGRGREAALKAAMSGLGLMIAAAGMPGQVRLASREQQPRPMPLVPKKKGSK
jgi:hypothetical protein